MRKNLSINSKRFIRTLSIGLSVYMALSPATALAAEDLEETPNDDVQEAAKAEETAKDAAVEAAKEEATQAVEAAQATANDENRAEFVETVKEQKEELEQINANSSEYETTSEEATPAENETPAEEAIAPIAENPVQEEIKKIEEETIKEAVDNIVKVDMSNVDSALDQISELVEETITDEEVAKELENVADTLIEIYDAQANTALEALKALDSTDEDDSIIVNDDGTVEIDWAGATEEVQALYDAYKSALDDKKKAEEAKTGAEDAVAKAEADKTAAITAGTDADAKIAKEQEKIAELDKEYFGNNKEKNKTVAESKTNCDTVINQLIAQTVAANKTGFAKDDTINGTGAKNQDLYRFFVNTVVDGEVYGCLTYYDHASSTILRKNFKVDKEGNIDYTYVPKAEWTKNDAACKEVVFGNGGNYIAAYVGPGSNASDCFQKGSFNGGKVSDLMRANMALNEAIDKKVEAQKIVAEETEAKAQAEIDTNKALQDINNTKAALESAKASLEAAQTNAKAALDKYNETVAKYEKAASLSDEIKKNEVEKAKQEYVKAEIEAWKKQQIVDAVDKAIEELEESKKETPEKEADVEVQEEIKEETVSEIDTLIEEETTSEIDSLIEEISTNLNLPAEYVEELVVQTIFENNDAVLESGNLARTENVAVNVELINANSDAMVSNVDVLAADVATVPETVEERAGEAEEEIQVSVETKEEIVALEENEESVAIEEEEVALAATLPTAEEQSKMSWWWLLIVAICGTTGYTWYKNHQKKVEVEEA